MVEKGGIDANRLNAIGYGEERPIASNDTEDGRRQNRRTESVAEYLIKK
jgi:OOP family OmpA-OmpF porin